LRISGKRNEELRLVAMAKQCEVRAVELRRQRRRRYYLANVGRIAERKRRYYLANKDRVLAAARQYREADPEKVRACHAAGRKRAAELGRFLRAAARQRSAEIRARLYSAAAHGATAWSTSTQTRENAQMEMDAEERNAEVERRRRFDRIDPRSLLNRQFLACSEAVAGADDRINRITKRQRRGRLAADEAARLIAEQERIKSKAEERRWRCAFVWEMGDRCGTG
jgi:hypothetical protein